MSVLVSNFESLDYCELLDLNAGSFKDTFITIGKVVGTVGIVLIAAAACIGGGPPAVPLAIFGAVVGIAALWAL